MQKKTPVRGFTLIELLVVIGIIAILAAVVIIAINPARQFAQARNSQRVSNVEAILNAIGQNMADNKGIFTCPGITLVASSTNITSSDGFNIMPCLVPTYISSVLFDPTNGTSSNAALYDTQYAISKDTNGRITVSAPYAELGQVVSITR